MKHLEITKVESHHCDRTYFDYNIVKRLPIQTFDQESHLIKCIAVELYCFWRKKGLGKMCPLQIRQRPGSPRVALE